MELPLTLVILTPAGEKARLACACVTLYARDNLRGENGGSMGILKGHMPAVIALEPGSTVKARVSEGAFSAYKVSGGFAKVENDEVTVITASAVDE